MYGKVFRQMYKGTLAMVGPWEAVVTFQQFIILAEKDGIIDMTPDAISRETTIPVEIIKKGIEALERPDPESRSPDEEGRRIVRLADNRTWGWRIVNKEKYDKIKSDDDRREYQKQYWRDKRSPSAKKPTTINTTQQHSIESNHIDIDLDLDIKKEQRNETVPVSKKITFSKWMETITDNEDAIPEEHHVFIYADRVGLPREFLTLAWVYFEKYYSVGNGKAKKYIDWAGHFRTAVEDGYGKLWGIDQNGSYYLTTAGKQLQIEAKA